MKQVKILADFHVGNDIEADLLLEVVQAAIGDVLYDKSKEWMIVNLGDTVDSHQVDFLKLENIINPFQFHQNDIDTIEGQ